MAVVTDRWALACSGSVGWTDSQGVCWCVVGGQIVEERGIVLYGEFW